MAQDFYAVLGLSRSVSPERIRSRFLELVRTRHPDRFQGKDKASAEEEFQVITQAFNVLSDPERRRQHDRELDRPEAGRQSADKDQVLRVYLQRGVKAYREEQYREAAENFDRATKQAPEDARAWHHLARALSHQRRYQAKAAGAIRRACELDPMNSDYLRVAGRIHAQAGMDELALQFLYKARRWGADDEELDQQIETLEKATGKRKTSLFGKAGG